MQLASDMLSTALGVAMALIIRLLLVGLFLPFSALDKILNFRAAMAQAEEAVSAKGVAILLVVGGLGIEICMSAAILCGVADRLAATVLAGYCLVTACLWKRFWRVPGFRLRGSGVDRSLFWDFLKNFALAGGFLVLAFGANVAGVRHFLADPLASSHPYASVAP